MTNHENTRPAIIPIDKNALFDALYDNEFHTFCPLDEVSDVIAAAPTLDYAPIRHGEWVEWWPGSCALILTGEEMLWQCSACTVKYTDKENFHYCPNCGAKMDKEGNNG